MSTKIALFATAFLLTACQGQNAFKRESNPTKNYQSVLDQSRAYSPEQQRAKQEQDARLQQLPCGVPFLLTVDQGDKGETAVFTEGVQKTVTIKIDRIAGQLAADRPWDVKAVDAPAGATFEQEKATADSRSYKLSWTAPKASNDITNKLVLRFKWDIEARCSATTPITKTVALVVVKGENDAVLAFREIKDIKFHDVLPFQLVLQGATDKLGKLSFVDKGGISTADAKITECGEPKAEGKKITYDCTFNSGALKDAEIKDLIGKDSVQEITLNARIEGKKPVEASAKVRVAFEKVEVAAAPVVPEAAPEVKPAAKKTVAAPKKGAKK